MVFIAALRATWKLMPRAEHSFMADAIIVMKNAIQTSLQNLFPSPKEWTVLPVRSPEAEPSQARLVVVPGRLALVQAISGVLLRRRTAPNSRVSGIY